MAAPDNRILTTGVALAALFLAIGFGIGRFTAPTEDRLSSEINHQADAGETAIVPRRRTEVPDYEPREKDSRDQKSRHSEEDIRWMEQALEKEKERRRASEITDEDTGGSVLRKILDHGADTAPLFKDFDSFSRPLRNHPEDALVIQVTPQNVNKVFRDFRNNGHSKVIFEFTAGEFIVRQSLMLEGLAFVTLKGAGKEGTTIRPTSPLILSKGVDNLLVQDLCFDSRKRGDGLLSSRGASSLLLSRVRMLGFDSAAGHSAALGCSAMSYIGAEDCEFLGGYGRGAFSGSAVSLRGRGFVYLKGCLLTELRNAIMGKSPAAAGSVCKIENCRSRYIRELVEHDKRVHAEVKNTSNTGLLTRRSTFIDAGSNSFEMLDTKQAPGILEAVHRARWDRVLQISCRDFQRDWASYIKVQRRDGLWSTYFNDPERGPLARNSGNSGKSGIPRPGIEALSAIRIAVEQHGNTSVAERIKPVVREVQLATRRFSESERLCWEVTLTYRGKVVVDATTGNVVQ